MKLTKQMREGFVARVLADVPKTDYNERWRKRALEVAINALPGVLQPVYSLYPEFFRTRYVHDGVGFTAHVPGNGNSDLVRKLICDDPAAKKCVDDARAQDETLGTLKDKLVGIAAACTTCEQLLAALPELEKYIPVSAAPTKNLPALANLVADLTRAGWPKETISAS